MTHERSDTSHDINVKDSKGVGPLRKSGVNVDYMYRSRCTSKSVVDQHSCELILS